MFSMIKIERYAVYFQLGLNTSSDVRNKLWNNNIYT